MTLEPDPDLHWTAFLYVSGELAPEASTAFERLLDDDQVAREAVASAVELVGAVAILGPESKTVSGTLKFTVPDTFFGRARVWAIALASAACLVAAVVPLLRTDRPRLPDTSEVAEAWSGLRGQSGGETHEEWLARVAETPSTEMVELPEMIEDDAPTERALPSWLLSATSASRDEDHREEN